MKIKSTLKYLPDYKIALVAVVYYLSARLGYFLAFPDTTSLPTWPPSGIGFALLVLLGRSSWPGITIGALVANLMAYWNAQELSSESIIAISTVISLGQTAEALLGNCLVKVWIKDDYPFRKTNNTFSFLFVTLLIGLVGSSIGTLALYLNTVIPIELVFQTGLHWWVGNVVGILLFTPFILSVAQIRQIVIDKKKLVEGSILFLCLIGLAAMVHYGFFNITWIHSLPYLLIPFLLWMAFRFNLLAAISIALTASLISIYFTIQHVGPFIQATSLDSMLLLQLYIGVISISTIVLSATVTERTSAENDLKLFNQNLESMVEERTRALNDEIIIRKNAEERLVQTNKELSKRNTELDNFVYSVSHDLRAPIASVLGLINLARSDKDPTMKQLYLDKIYSSALQQDAFIREILDQSRNSRLEVNKEEIHFEPLIEETFNQLKFATSTGSAVERVITVNQRESFFSDRWRLKVIMNNIISNAIRYRNGRDPVIKVNVHVDNHLALVEIEDNGRGIAREHLDKVCNMFYRATDDGAGSGLGLYIVKETMDKLHGSIQIDSTEGMGTTVKLMIPEL